MLLLVLLVLLVLVLALGFKEEKFKAALLLRPDTGCWMWHPSGHPPGAAALVGVLLVDVVWGDGGETAYYIAGTSVCRVEAVLICIIQ